MNQELAQKIQNLKGFYQQDPENTAILIDLFESYLQLGSFDEGLEFYSTIESHIQQDPSVSFRAGTLALAAGNYELAESCFNTTASAHGDHVAVQFNLAYARYFQQKFSEAAEGILQIKDWQSVPESQLILTRCLHHLNRIDDAVDIIQAFIKVFPEHSEAKGLLSLLLLDQGEDEQAAEVAKTALSEDDSLLEALIALSSSAISLQNPSLAQEILDDALEKHAQVGRLWSNRGQLDMLSLDLVEAKESLRKAVELMPNHIGTWHLLGWCQIMTSEYQDAMHSFDAALELNRNFGDSHGGQAVTLVLLDRLDEANDAMRRAVKLDPESMSGLYAKSLLLEKEGKVEEAKSIVENLMQSSVGKGAMGFLPMIQQYVNNRTMH